VGRELNGHTKKIKGALLHTLLTGFSNALFQKQPLPQYPALADAPSRTIKVIQYLHNGCTSPLSIHCSLQLTG
jgi:hypothetical protein